MNFLSETGRGGKEKKKKKLVMDYLKIKKSFAALMEKKRLSNKKM